MNIFLVAIGGAIGSVLRYLSYGVISKIIKNSIYAGFPFATMFVNILGSTIAGVFYYFFIHNLEIDEKIKSFFLVGFLGGFTTFSAFSIDFFRLFLANKFFIAFAYAFSSVVLAILFLFLGFYLMKIIFI